jgi:hypothetical protein
MSDYKVIDIPEGKTVGVRKWQPIIKKLKSLPKGKALAIPLNGSKSLSSLRINLCGIAPRYGLKLTTSVDNKNKCLLAWKKVGK